VSGSRPARILFVDSSGYEDLGGASTVLDELIERVDRTRFVPALACLSPGRWPELVRARGTPAYSFPRARLRSARNLVGIVAGLAGVIRSRRIDLVHASENTALLYATLAGRLCGTPVLWHIHSPLQPRARSERAVAAVLRRLPPAHIVFTSEGARQRTIPFPGVAATVVPPGVDLARRAAGDGARARAAFGIPVGAPLVTMFARIEPMKGQADLVRALGTLRRTHPDVRAVLCGPPDRASRYWARLGELVGELDLAEHLQFPGDVRPPLKDDLVAASDVVAHPSLAESFGLAVLEAMAGGRAVVAGDTDGPRLLIEDGVDGVLVPPGDPDALGAALARLLDHPEERAALGAAAQRSARRHDVVAMVERFEAVWDEVLAQRGPG